MKEIKLKELNETIYYDKCENGLGIYIWVNKKVNTFKGTITFLVGSSDVEFSVGKKKLSVPYGTAHYLEHMLCKNENGETILGEFQKLGSYSNASTYSYKTIYEFVGTEKYLENIDLLLKITQEKKFIEKHFDTEKGPILEETRMNLDRPNRVIGNEINCSIFSKYPNRTPGTGTIDDVEKMRLEDLKLLYDCFYHPQNSFVTITGNVDPLEVIHFIKEHQKKKEVILYKNPILEKYREPKKVVQKYKEVFVNIEIPKVYICTKIPLNIFSGYDILTVIDSIQLVLSSNFGVTSFLRDDLIEKKLVLNINASVYFERDYLIIKVFSKTKYPEEIIDILKDKLNHLDIIKTEIERKKKSEIANLVLGYEDPESVNDSITFQIGMFGKIIEDEKQKLEKITVSTIKDIFSKITFKETSVIVVLPKKQKDE